MKKLCLFIFAMFSLSLLGCSFNSNTLDIQEELIGVVEDLSTNNLSTNNLSESFDIVAFSKEILTLMQEDSWSGLSQFAHPVKGVRFSPYTYIDLDTSVVLYPSDFESDLNSGELLWGYTDGAGFELIETKYDYFKEWVYSTGFLYANQILINQKVARGNNLNNIDDVFPNSQFVEYYFDGFDPQYEGIDRLSLTLVFEEHQGYYYLVGVIRGSWTI